MSRAQSNQLSSWILLNGVSASACASLLSAVFASNATGSELGNIELACASLHSGSDFPTNNATGRSQAAHRGGDRPARTCWFILPRFCLGNLAAGGDGSAGPGGGGGVGLPGHVLASVSGDVG